MASQPSPIRRESVITRAAQEICRFIEVEGLSPADPLPTESRLAEMLGISRNSVREALRILHGLGHVEKVAGRRVVVTAAARSGAGVFDEDVMIEAAPIANEVRSHIVQKCAELAARRLTMTELADLERALGELEDAIARDDAQTAKTAHDRFHGLMMAGARNPLLVAMYNQAKVARLSNITPEHRSFADRRHLAHHRSLFEALGRRDGDAAGRVVREHFHSLGLMLDVVVRTHRKAEPAPVTTLEPLPHLAGKAAKS